MKAKRETDSWSRVTVLFWASLWMLAAPLFHVHPEADHRHGEVGHIHGGTVHLVWSPDLDCEFGSHRHVDQTNESTQSGLRNPGQFSHLGDGHAEFSLSLMSDSTDRKLPKPFLAEALDAVAAIVLHETGPARLERNTTLLSFALVSRAIAPRAPPYLI